MSEIKITCKNCSLKTQRYCRSKSIAKNSLMCRNAQRHKYRPEPTIDKLKKLLRKKIGFR
jgi:hypothetical protein